MSRSKLEIADALLRSLRARGTQIRVHDARLQVRGEISREEAAELHGAVDQARVLVLFNGELVPSTEASALIPPGYQPPRGERP